MYACLPVTVAGRFPSKPETPSTEYIRLPPGSLMCSSRPEDAQERRAADDTPYSCLKNVAALKTIVESVFFVEFVILNCGVLGNAFLV